MKWGVGCDWNGSRIHSIFVVLMSRSASWTVIVLIEDSSECATPRRRRPIWLGAYQKIYQVVWDS